MGVWDIRACPLQAVAEHRLGGLAGRVCFGWVGGGGFGGLGRFSGYSWGVGGEEGMLGRWGDGEQWWLSHCLAAQRWSDVQIKEGDDTDRVFVAKGEAIVKFSWGHRALLWLNLAGGGS